MTDTATRPAALDTARPDHFGRRAWAVLLVLCGTVFLEGLDVSMMGVALPSIRADLDLATSSLQWVVSAYVLGYGGFVLLGGRAADLLGRRRMFLAALVVFIAFSGLGGLAPEGWVLILARFATGVSAGFLTPASLSIITTNFDEGEARNRALLVYGGAAAGGFSLGMVAGGLLTSVDWRWVFFAPVLFAVGLLAVALRFLPYDESPPLRRSGFDVSGAISLTTGDALARPRRRAPAGRRVGADGRDSGWRSGAARRVRGHRAAHRRPRWSVSASSVPPRWCGPISAPCCSSDRSSGSSSSRCCTSRSCAAGRRCPPVWR